MNSYEGPSLIEESWLELDLETDIMKVNIRDLGLYLYYTGIQIE